MNVRDDPVSVAGLRKLFLTDMEYPLIDRQLLSALRLAHGIFNVIVVGLFLYQARLGMKIRRERRAARPLPFPVIKRHRRIGPGLAAMAAAGYFFGIVLVLLSTGGIFEHPSHLIVGSLIVLLLAASVMLSRRIKGPDSPYRAPHFATGIVLVILFLFQVLLGIGALF
jgi:hypothetical protein